VLGDAGTVADHVRAQVRLCIRAPLRASTRLTHPDGWHDPENAGIAGDVGLQRRGAVALRDLRVAA
jgi:hypothetical protein